MIEALDQNGEKFFKLTNVNKSVLYSLLTLVNSPVETHPVQVVVGKQLLTTNCLLGSHYTRKANLIYRLMAYDRHTIFFQFFQMFHPILKHAKIDNNFFQRRLLCSITFANYCSCLYSKTLLIIYRSVLRQIN